MQTDRIGRIVRTLVQVGLIQVLMQSYQAFATPPLTDIQYGALTTALTTVFTLVQLVLEDSGTIPALMRSVPAGDDKVKGLS